MSKYTTGEIAKLCGVTVRTVQYYDTRGILVPSEISEGGRRIYSEDDLGKLKIICFLRELDLPISSIAKLLTEEDSGSVILTLLEQQEQLLREEVNERRNKLDMLEQIRRVLKHTDSFSVESIGDIAYQMKNDNKKKLKKLRATLVLTAIPIGILQWTSIILWIATGIWWLFAVYVLAAVPYAVWVTKYYFKRVAYICPKCHEVFKPAFKEAFWAGHTPTLRKLTCPHCSHKGYCVEVAAPEEEKEAQA